MRTLVEHQGLGVGGVHQVGLGLHSTPTLLYLREEGLLAALGHAGRLLLPVVQVVLPPLELPVLPVLLLTDLLAHLHLLVYFLQTGLLLDAARPESSPELNFVLASAALQLDVLDVDFYVVGVGSFLGRDGCCFGFHHVGYRLELGDFEYVLGEHFLNQVG